jgi:hypothetical protein
MDYADYDIIKIFPGSGLYIGNSTSVNYQHLTDLNINYLININSVIENTSNCVIKNTNCVIYNISVVDDVNFTDTLINIDFDKTNEFIINALQNNNNILIIDTTYLLPLSIVCAFLIKYIDITYSESIYWLSKKTYIDIIPPNVCYKLFLYYVNLYEMKM